MAVQTEAIEQQALTDHTLYQQPAKFCDIVMKGGITSGVVYPLAVCELAQEYQFKSIGGASAGAIAAAATAAAELGRTNPAGGFAEIAKLPAWIGSDANLYGLFQPQAETQGLFRTVTAMLGPSKGKLLRALFAVMRSFPIATLIGLVPAVALAASAIIAGGVHLIIGILASLILAVLGLLAALAYAFVLQATRAIPNNHYGLCSGYAPYDPDQPQALTTWMTRYINTLAGRDPDGPPVTFGDLWDTSDPNAEHAIDLALMTTNLTQGRAHRLPFRDDVFYFKPADFDELFPSKVVTWMKDHARTPSDGKHYPDLRPLPVAADLPIVVAARMSLSFPVLLSAVPLYRIDHSRALPTEQKVPEVCWFSDGGITSNFPVHFFDRALPRWPTFGINLRGFHPDHPRQPKEVENVFFPQDNEQGILEWWSRFDSPPLRAGVPVSPSQPHRSGFRERLVPTPSRLLGFLGAIKDTMQNAADNALIRQPGYRDRVAHISLEGDEGGLNLTMPSDVLHRLSTRGMWAGRKLRTQFDVDNHRWVRYRSTMACVERLLLQFHRSWTDHSQGIMPYDALVTRSESTPPWSYRWKRKAQRDFASASTRKLVELVETWERPLSVDNKVENFDEGAPSPAPELRVMPRL
jgi:hypothetical protein